MSEVLIDNEILISLVESRPVLWDKTLDIFKDRDATRNAWREVCLEIRNDFDELDDKEKNAFGKEVLKRWKNLRDSFAKAEKKLKESKASGSKGTKKKKYIFNEELQFLKKVYSERETTESYDIENEKENTIPEANISKETDQTVTSNTTEKSKPSQRTRKHQKMDEIDIKIIKALDKPQQEPNSMMSFFHSLVPYVQKFNDNELLEFQMGVLQVISRINSKKTAVSHQEISTPSLYQPAPCYSQSFQCPNVPQHQFTPQTTSSFNPQHSVPYQAASFTGQIQHPFATQSTPFPLHVQHQIDKPPVTFTGAQDLRNEEPSARQLYETFTQNEESSDRASSVCSAASSINFDFTNI